MQKIGYNKKELGLLNRKMTSCKKFMLNFYAQNFRMEKHMDIRPKDILIMKKFHPCGGNEMFVIRSGMDFKLRCIKCGHEFMVPRNKIEKRIKKVIREE